MKRPPLYILLIIPVFVLILIWILTFAFGLMRQPDDVSVILGVVVLFFALLSIAFIINYFKNKFQK